jgi:hypothetical protein
MFGGSTPLDADDHIGYIYGAGALVFDINSADRELRRQADNRRCTRSIKLRRLCRHIL